MHHARSAGATAVLYLISSLIPHPSSHAWAAHPFITDDTGTQGKGNWQLELQYEYGRNDATADAGSGPVRQVSKASVFTTVLTYGLLENLDMALGLNYLNQRVIENGVSTEDSSGMADSTIELKWRFYEADGLSFALKPGVILPTGDENKGLGTGRTSWGIALLATYEAEPWMFLGNVAYSKIRYKLPQDAAENHSHLWRVSGGVSYAATGKLRLVGEGGLRRNEAKDDAFLPDGTSQFGMVGIIYSPTKNMDFDAGFRKNFNNAELDKTYLVGATFRW
jgi:hypothetical protein